MRKCLTSVLVVNNHRFIQELKQRWASILHYVCGVHKWTENGQQRQCAHAPLSAMDLKTRMWLNRDSDAFRELAGLVQDRRLLADLEQMALFKHTGEYIQYLDRGGMRCAH